MSGIYLVIILLFIYIIDTHKFFFQNNKLFLISLFTLILFNVFSIQDHSYEKTNNFLRLFFPDFIFVESVKLFFIATSVLMNTIFIFHCVTINSGIVKFFLSRKPNNSFNKIAKTILNLLNYRWIAFSIINIFAFPLFISKWDIAINSDITMITQISYNNFSVFNIITRSFFLIYYFLFLCLIFTFSIFLIPILYDIIVSLQNSKKIKYRFRSFSLFVCIPLLMNTLLFSYTYNFINKLFDSDRVISLLIDSSYNNIIGRCKKLVEGISESKFEYLLLINPNEVSLASRKKINDNVQYKFAIGNCQDNTYKIVYESPINKE